MDDASDDMADASDVMQLPDDLDMTAPDEGVSPESIRQDDALLSAPDDDGMTPDDDMGDNMDSDDGLSLLGAIGGGGGGGHGGGGHGGGHGGFHGGGRGRGRGGGFWGWGPWYDGPWVDDVYELVDDEGPTAEDVAKALAKEMKKPNVGADVGFSIPALWGVMNGMKPMSKAQANLLLSSALDASHQAAAGLSGSDASKAATLALAIDNTRQSIANASADPLDNAVADGVRQMTAQGFTAYNTLAETNAAEAQNLGLLWQDMKTNAANLPKAAAGAVSAAYEKVASTVSSLSTWAKVLVITGAVAVVGGTGYGLYRKFSR